MNYLISSLQTLTNGNILPPNGLPPTMLSPTILTPNVLPPVLTLRDQIQF